MDEKSFEKWSETLTSIRDLRRSSLEDHIATNGSSFKVHQFGELAMASLDESIMKWWSIEQESWQNAPPVDEELAMKQVKEEMESVIEFEMEALNRDLEYIRTKLSVAEGEAKNEIENIQKFSDDIRKDYSIKISSLAKRTNRRKSLSGTKPLQESRSRNRSGSTQRSGLSVVPMFILGLFLGGGSAIYFWDQASKQDKIHLAEISRVRSEKRQAEESMIVMQDVLSQLAHGKIRNIPEIEKAMKPIKASIIRERKNIDASFLKKKENIINKIPPGDRLDRTLNNLAQEKKDRIDVLNEIEIRKLKPFKEELATIRELIGN